MRRYASSFNPSIWKGWTDFVPPLLHQMCESQPFVPIFFHPYHFMLSFFPLHFFLEVMEWVLGSGDCHTGQLIWNNEEFKPLLSHLSGFVADRIKNWKGGSERRIVCVWERERKGAGWCLYVLAHTVYVHITCCIWNSQTLDISHILYVIFNSAWKNI